MGGSNHAPDRVMLLYWGRRGLTRLALQMARAAVASPRIEATISVSRQNESFAAFAELGSRLVPVETFVNHAGAAVQSWRIPFLRRQLVEEVRTRRIAAVIELMPHVWSSLVLPAVQDLGVRYAAIVHDGIPHPGDYRSWSVQRLLDRAVARADVVLTLSEAVAGCLAATGRAERSRICTLFHPYLDFGARGMRSPPLPGEPIRLAFLGRIMPYKGLPLFLDTVELLRGEGLAVEAGVFGEGYLGASAARLQRLGAEVVNRWLTEAEIGAILSRYHALLLSHIEASQSGIAAAAFGAGLPVVATPVGGLIEQVHDGLNGVLAHSADAPALARSVRRLVLDMPLYRAICAHNAGSQSDRSMDQFVVDCVFHTLHARNPGAGAN